MSEPTREQVKRWIRCWEYKTYAGKLEASGLEIAKSWLRLEATLKSIEDAILEFGEDPKACAEIIGEILQCCEIRQDQERLVPLGEKEHYGRGGR